MSEFSSLRRLDANRIFWQESVKILKRRVFQLEVNLNAVFRGIIYSLCRFDPKPMFWKQKLKIWPKKLVFYRKFSLSRASMVSLFKVENIPWSNCVLHTSP